MPIAMKYGSGSNNGGENSSVTLLWTNPDPTSSFSSQTISLYSGVSGYSLIYVEYRFSTGTVDRFSVIHLVPLLQTGDNFALAINAYGNNRTGGRNFSLASDTTITFGAASYNGSSNNSYAIPWHIYGIR